MRQIDTSTATGTKPTPPAAGTAGFFQETDPSGGTVVPAWWLNSIQDEIINAITAAGLTPDKTDDTQLSAAISAIAADAAYGAQSLTSTGYQIFGSGLIVQWGTEAVFRNTTTSAFNFPTAFNTACLAIVGSYSGVADIDNGNVSVDIISATQMRIRNSSNEGDNPADIFWVAIGH